MSNFIKFTDIDLYEAVYKNTSFDVRSQAGDNVFRPVSEIAHTQIFWPIVQELADEL